MSKFGFMSLLVCAGLLVTPALAQDSVKPASASAIDQVPAGAMGFFVINNVKATADNVDRFLVDIGVSGMVKQSMPSGLLDLLKTDLGLGEGFNPTGGVAIVMLDGKPFGVDIGDVAIQKMNNQQVKDVKLPFVAMIPGKDFDSVMPAFKDAKKEKVGNFTKVELPPGPMFVGQKNGYVLVSPTDKALAAVIASSKNAKDDLSAGQKEVLARADVGLFVNMKVAGPVITKIMESAEAKMKEGSGPRGMSVAAGPGMGFGKMMAMNRETLAQTQSVLSVARIAKTGLVFEQVTEYTPDSEVGKQLKSIKAPTKPLLGRLPNNSYVVAAGSAGNPASEGAPAMDKMTASAISDMLVGASQGKITEAQAKKLNDLCLQFNKEVTGGQLVIGQAPEGAGLVGVAMLLECKDAQKVKGMLADAVAQAQDIIKSVKERDLEGLTVTYTKGSAADGMDTIEIAHPELANMSPEEHKLMSQFIGEDKIRLAVTSPDKNTVLITFGGGKAFLDQATMAAKEGGPLPKDKGIMASMEMMPKNTVFVMAVNAGDLFEAITKGVDIAGVGAALPPIKLSSQTPLMFGVGVTASSTHTVAYVPSEVIKEVAGIVMMFVSHASPRRAAPVAPGDF